MIKKALMAVLASFGLIAAATPHANATIQETWTSIAAACTVQGEQLAYVNPIYGTVSFAANEAGDFYLTCPVGSINLIPTRMGLTFYNDNGTIGGVNHCFVTAVLQRASFQIETGADLVTVSSVGSQTAGHQFFDGPINYQGQLFGSYYWVTVQLHRDSATAACNPVFVGAILYK